MKEFNEVGELVIGFSITFIILFIFMYIISLAFSSDLKDLEKTNPRYRKYLKDKYDI